MKHLVIPDALISLNEYIAAERANRYAGASLKKQMTQSVAWHAKAQKLGAIRSGAQFIFHWYCRNKKKDKDNIAFAKKFIFDGLVLAGYLANDGWEDIGEFTDYFAVDEDNPRIEVDIYEFADIR